MTDQASMNNPNVREEHVRGEIERRWQELLATEGDTANMLFLADNLEREGQKGRADSVRAAFWFIDKQEALLRILLSERDGPDGEDGPWAKGWQERATHPNPEASTPTSAKGGVVQAEIVAQVRNHADGEMSVDWLLEGGLHAVGVDGDCFLYVLDIAPPEDGHVELYAALASQPAEGQKVTDVDDGGPYNGIDWPATLRAAAKRLRLGVEGPRIADELDAIAAAITPDTKGASNG